MIKRKLRKHTIKETKFITCESMTRGEAFDWICQMLKNGFNVVDYKIEDYQDNTVRCVIEYNK